MAGEAVARVRIPRNRGVALRILRRNPSSIVGMIILSFYVVFAVIGPPLFPNAIFGNATDVYQGPSAQHLLGTDYAGRDILHLILAGTRPVMEVAATAALLTIILGCAVGLVAGFFRGGVDGVLMRITDLFLTVPGFPLLVLIAALTTLTNPILIAVVLSLTGWGGLARAVRSQVLSFREREYIEAARSLRLSSRHIILREIMPNIMPYIAMNLMLGVSGAIYAEVGLFFLGVLPYQPTNWGVMLNLAYTQGGAIYSSRSILYLLSPIFAILLLQLGVVLVLRFLDEVFNPRLRAA